MLCMSCYPVIDQKVCAYFIGYEMHALSIAMLVTPHVLFCILSEDYFLIELCSVLLA